MARIEYTLTHKHQTKSFDCWYACIQMIRTWRTGHKVKPKGTHTAHLHKGVMGHRLSTDFDNSKHLKNVLVENELIVVDDQLLESSGGLAKALDRYGPFVVGGDQGNALKIPLTRAYLLADQGHFVVLAGCDDDQKPTLFKIHDPYKSKVEWRDAGGFIAKIWDHQGAAFANKTKA